MRIGGRIAFDWWYAVVLRPSSSIPRHTHLKIGQIVALFKRIFVGNIVWKRRNEWGHPQLKKIASSSRSSYVLLFHFSWPKHLWCNSCNAWLTSKQILCESWLADRPVMTLMVGNIVRGTNQNVLKPIQSSIQFWREVGHDYHMTVTMGPLSSSVSTLLCTSPLYKGTFKKGLATSFCPLTAQAYWL